ncbi:MULTISPECIES: FHA domain-containing protein [unclassified Pseudofrankia]|uniref:FHA domain-containing protein n=1 Tax=unclassified Pseudofrankia TaxID=2994372 RepID=UPI0008D97C3F|nr:MULTISPECIES: FHA domain-containing protein [unclassified Pseudofrankia]MDT3439831.1 FHA domain-containing protein [Pseudofrankia sp. BMG5.37]OHV59330.1 forkhead-associated protein [Pseudofrankia sp. BMG5.36]
MPPVALRVSTPADELTLPGDRPAVVGRSSDADVVINHPKVSRRHVALEPTPEGWVARDLSTNGIWYDGQRVGSVQVSGDVTRLRLGGADGPELALTALVPAAAPPAAPAEPDLDELETRLAPGGAQGPAQRTGRGPAPAATPGWPAGAQPPAGVPAQRPAPAPAPSPRRKPPRWLSTVPTLIWLFSAAFAIGALVALS